MKEEPFYHYPEYYDIAFSRNRKTECDFFESCFKKYANIEVKSLLDIACGTGQHLFRMAERGYRVCGLDISQYNIDFLKDNADRLNISIPPLKADMRDFQTPELFDACICMQDSIGHLLTNDDIIRHFKSVGKSLKKGGLYILDKLIMNDWLNPTSKWVWTQTRKNITVKTTFDTFNNINPVTHLCKESLIFEVSNGKSKKVFRQNHINRIIFPQELLALAEASKCFEFVDWFANFNINKNLNSAKRPVCLVAVFRKI